MEMLVAYKSLSGSLLALFMIYVLGICERNNAPQVYPTMCKVANPNNVIHTDNQLLLLGLCFLGTFFSTLKNRKN